MVRQARWKTTSYVRGLKSSINTYGLIYGTMRSDGDDGITVLPYYLSRDGSTQVLKGASSNKNIIKERNVKIPYFIGRCNHLPQENDASKVHKYFKNYDGSLKDFKVF